MAVKIWLDDNGVADILRRNPNLQEMEQETMQQRLDEIRADFLTEFGEEGNFELHAIQTREGKTHGRLTYRIVAADAKTTAVLKKHPGWLGRYM